MPDTVTVPSDRSPAPPITTRYDRALRGMIAGGIGGLLAGGTKILGEVIYPPRQPGDPIPPEVMVSRLTEYLSGSPLQAEHATLAIQSVHWLFSLGVGITYGLIAEFWGKATAFWGLGFGMVLLLLTHETTLPLLGLSNSWAEMPLQEHLSEIFTHAIFGVTAEMTRRFLRTKWLGQAQLSLTGAAPAAKIHPFDRAA